MGKSIGNVFHPQDQQQPMTDQMPSATDAATIGAQTNTGGNKLSKALMGGFQGGMQQLGGQQQPSGGSLIPPPQPAPQFDFSTLMQKKMKSPFYGGS